MQAARHVQRLLCMARAYIGTSGWMYPGWRDHLYATIPVRRWLEVASRTFGALEINGSFYTQIRPETYQRWAKEVPPGFRFTLKAHRYVTHYKRLRECKQSITMLRDQAVNLGAALEAVVWQLPSNFRRDDTRLDEFLKCLDEIWPSVRHAFELRHRSWFVPEVAARLGASRAAICLGDAPDFPLWREVSTDLVYVRLHGHTRKYASRYSTNALRVWAEETRRWLREGRDVHVYFDNDAEGHAVENARTFSALVAGLPPPARLPVAYSGRPASGAEPAAPSRRRSGPRPAPAWSGRRSKVRT